MLYYGFITFVAFSTCIALTDWRKGLYLVVIVGVLQDPVRKLIPGAPAYMVLCYLPVWSATVFSLLAGRGRHYTTFRYFLPKLVSRYKLFILTLIPAAMISFQHGAGAWKIILLGAFAYLTPLFGVTVGFSLADRPERLRKFLLFYALFTSLVLCGGVVEYLNLMPGWLAVGTKSLNMEWIRHVEWGKMIYLMSGFYRSPDVMGWHAATLVMLSLSMLLMRGATRRWPWLILALWGGVNVLLSGRNKMIMMPAAWLLFIAAIYLYTRKAGRIIRLVLPCLLIAGGVLMASAEIGMHSDYFYYVKKTGGLVTQRVEAHGLDAVITTYNQSGFFGKGLGTALQGIQHLGLNIQRSWQEGGMSKLMVELGVPGLLAFALVVLSLSRVGVGLVKSRDLSHHPAAPLVYGLLAMAAANACSFVVSQQVYSDGLIVNLLAVLIGAALAAQRWYGPPPHTRSAEKFAEIEEKKL